MATKQVLPVIVEGTFVFNASNQVIHDTWPTTFYDRDGFAVTPPPLTGVVGLRAHGRLRGALARVATGSGVTLADLQLSVFRDLSSYPSGATTGTPATELAPTAARTERKVYQSQVITTPTPSATAADIDDRLSTAEPFNNGLWIVGSIGTVTGSGDTVVFWRLLLEVVHD